MGARIFVTGAESFIGRALQRACAHAGVECAGLDLAPSASLQVVRGDIRDPGVASLIPKDVDAVVHLAALSRDADCRGQIRACLDANVMATINLRRAAEERQARQFIFASSEWVYGNGPFDPPRDETSPIDLLGLGSEYALSKAVAEAALRRMHGARSACATTVLRFGIVYGPRPANWSAVEALTHAVATQDRVSVGSLKTARRFVHVDDIAAAILACIGRDGLETFNIQGPALVSLGDVIAEAGRQLGRRRAIAESDAANPSIRNVEASLVTAQTGWRPRIGIAEGIATLLPAVTARAA